MPEFVYDRAAGDYPVPVLSGLEELEALVA